MPFFFLIPITVATVYQYNAFYLITSERISRLLFEYNKEN